MWKGYQIWQDLAEPRTVERYDAACELNSATSLIFHFGDLFLHLCGKNVTSA